MKLIIYKGFNKEFLEKIEETPLCESTIEQKKDVLKFTKKYIKSLRSELMQLDEDDTVWATYEEYSIIKKYVDNAIEDDDLEVVIYNNNLYPEYYPIEFELHEELAQEYLSLEDSKIDIDESEECAMLLKVFPTIVNVNDKYYGSFYNFEQDLDGNKIVVKDYYPCNLEILDEIAEPELKMFLNGDIKSYIECIEDIKDNNLKIVSIDVAEGENVRKIENSFKAFCLNNNIKLIKSRENLPENIELENDLISIAQNELNIAGFSSFRKIKFYKNPDISNEVIELSQGQLIQEIIHQAENSYAKTGHFRDIFITASTGAGKSVMFQIPAVYLAKKYGKITIIIEPVKALMQDQKEKLNNSGYTRVETFNSDLITQVEKENVLRRIKDGEVDLLYLSPETLLSYSLETIIGDREIGLMIVDEAHTVTTWGENFRPDYWYLGGYIDRLRHQIQTSAGMKRKQYHFPICAFTATAVNGGPDDSVSDTIVSLYMQNPVKYIGYIKRDDISFKISCKGDNKKLTKEEYDQNKTNDLDNHIRNWLNNNEKTIVYFPYATQAYNAHLGLLEFAGITTDKRIGKYTGKNVDESSDEMFNETKRKTFEAFRKGMKPIIYATKAFGMGIDVDDVENVYHYAVTGNLCDYVQEIGRAARKKEVHGTAITDYYYNDMTFMDVLFGMSSIKQYQIKKVLEEIYNTYKSKNESRNFLITPESFTYIFKGKNDDECINKLKTCLLMLEKDLSEKYAYKVLVSKPQSVFTKAFICIEREYTEKVLSSKYGEHIKFISKGRKNERSYRNTTNSDLGDIYLIDLKSIWEKHYKDMSFPAFKFWYFNAHSDFRNKENVMPEISKYIYPRQQVKITTKGDIRLTDLRETIISDFEYIGDVLYNNFTNKYFTMDDFKKLLKEKYGDNKARIIADSLFDLIDPDNKCVKRRNNTTNGKANYTLANGSFKEMMKKVVSRSNLLTNVLRDNESEEFAGYMSLTNDVSTNIVLKLLSVFDYITYEVTGGREPEIFIRLNDPNKVKGIVAGNIPYNNDYVKKARDKHDRDRAILVKFFRDLKTDEERWDYIEDYFLGYDVLEDVEIKQNKEVKMKKSLDKEHSYQTTMYKSWGELKLFFNESDYDILDKLDEEGIKIPEYLETAIKHSEEGKNIVMSWPSKNVLICNQETSNKTLDYFEDKGWHAYRIYGIDYKKIKGELE